MLLFTITGILVLTTLAGLYQIRPDSVQGRFLIWQVIESRLSQSPWTGQGALQDVYMPGSLLIAGIGFGLFSYPLSVPLLVSLSLIVLAIISQNSFTSCRISLSKSRWIILFLLGVFLIFTTREYAIGEKADLLLKESRHAPDILTDPPLLGCYEQLQNNPDFILSYGKNLYEQGLYENVRIVLEQGYRLKPSSELVCDLGKCYRHNNLFSQAEQAYP